MCVLGSLALHVCLLEVRGAGPRVGCARKVCQWRPGLSGGGIWSCSEEGTKRNMALRRTATHRTARQGKARQVIPGSFAQGASKYRPDLGKLDSGGNLGCTQSRSCRKSCHVMTVSVSVSATRSAQSPHRQGHTVTSRPRAVSDSRVGAKRLDLEGVLVQKSCSSSATHCIMRQDG